LSTAGGDALSELQSLLSHRAPALSVAWQRRIQEVVMRVGIVGGLDRVEPHYERLALEAGHEALFHDGHVGGRGRLSLERLVERCDVVIIITDVNSHGAVQFARQRLRLSGREPVLLRRCGPSRFASLLGELSGRRPPSAAAPM
jgi:hypothetical protein